VGTVCRIGITQCIYHSLQTAITRWYSNKI